MIFITELSNFQKQINPCMKCAASTGREFGADVRDGYTLHGRLHVTQGTRYTGYTLHNVGAIGTRGSSALHSFCFYTLCSSII